MNKKQRRWMGIALLAIFIGWWVGLTKLGDVEPFLIFSEPELISDSGFVSTIVIALIVSVHVIWLWAIAGLLQGKHGITWKD